MEIWRETANIERLLPNGLFNLNKCLSCELEFFDPNTIGDEIFYNEINKNRSYYDDAAKSEYLFTANFVKDEDLILDIGCGTGLFSKYLPKKNHFTGIELSEDACKEGAKNNIKILNEKIEEHVINNKNRYDVVSSFQVLEHINNPLEFIQNSLVALKKGGLFIFAVPNNESYLKNSPNYKYNLPPHHLILWKKKQCDKIAEIFNLELIEFNFEKIHEIHKKEAQFAFLYNILSVLYRNKTSKINFNAKHFKITNITYRIIKKTPSFLLNLIFLLPKYKYGHTMTFVFRKK